MALSKPMAPTDTLEPHPVALTAKQSAFDRCANPFCNAAMEAKPGKKYCSDRCRMDAYALRRAKALLDKVGIVEFHRRLDLPNESNNQ
jgi:hypothetical protein